MVSSLLEGGGSDGLILLPTVSRVCQGRDSPGVELVRPSEGKTTLDAMTTDSPTDRALHAAVATARELARGVGEAVVLKDGSNLLVHLRPAPVVARVATGTAEMRPDGAALAREVAIALTLARAGAPVVPPSGELPPGPHRRDGFTLSFWQHVAAADRPLDAYEAGRRLRICHEALAELGGSKGGAASAEASAPPLDLPRLGALVEAEAIVERLAADGTLGTADAALLRAVGMRTRDRVEGLALPLQPIHGDAHVRNVIDDPVRGPLWNDWEDAFLGPRAWDLACLYAALPPFGTHDPAAAGQAYRGYGAPVHADVLRALVAARRFQLLAWGAALARGRPERRPWVDERIAQLRERENARG
jgi:Ser/Thr protein kinase RdoA (MazF antagonist)